MRIFYGDDHDRSLTNLNLTVIIGAAICVFTYIHKYICV